MATKLAKAIAKEKEDKKHAEKAMPLYVWVPAFQVPNFGGECISLPLHDCVLLQAYMMAAEASGHFDYAIGVTHMHIVMRVADKLRRDKKPQGVAVAYDRLVRCVIFSHSPCVLLFCRFSAQEGLGREVHVRVPWLEPQEGCQGHRRRRVWPRARGVWPWRA